MSVNQITIYEGNALEVLEDMMEQSAQMVCTSPPYYNLRDYKNSPVFWPDGWRGCLGNEPTIELYRNHIVEIFRKIRRVLRNNGILFLVLGDSYFTSMHRISNRLKPKDLLGIPWQVALALRDDGWWLRSDIIWHKPNPLPESVNDRPTKAHEYVFLLSKSQNYFWNKEGVIQKGSQNSHGGGQNHKGRWGEVVWGKGHHSGLMNPKPTGFRNVRTVWEIPVLHSRIGVTASFPEGLVKLCVAAGTKEGDTVLDPFLGSGTTALVAAKMGRNAIGIEMNRETINKSVTRLGDYQYQLIPKA